MCSLAAPQTPNRARGSKDVKEGGISAIHNGARERDMPQEKQRVPTTLTLKTLTQKNGMEGEYNSMH